MTVKEANDFNHEKAKKKGSYNCRLVVHHSVISRR